MLVFVLNQTQKANTGKIQTPVYENVREFGFLRQVPSGKKATFGLLFCTRGVQNKGLVFLLRHR